MNFCSTRISSENLCPQGFSNALCGGMRMATRVNPSCLDKPSVDGLSRLDDESKTEGGNE